MSRRPTKNLRKNATWYQKNAAVNTRHLRSNFFFFSPAVHYQIAHTIWQSSVALFVMFLSHKAYQINYPKYDDAFKVGPRFFFAYYPKRAAKPRSGRSLKS